MKQIFLIVGLLLTVNSMTFSQVIEKCFESDWLQQSHEIKFTLTGAAVAGTFTVSRDGEETAYDFTGALKVGILTVKFTGGKIPDISPSEMKGLVWTLSSKGAKGDSEVLKIKVYGKNYQTNKYEISYAAYEPCTSGYTGAAAAAKGAKPVLFAAGANSAKTNISFADNEEQKVFQINARKGQSLEIEAYGCGIAVYLPDKKLHEELENADDPKSGNTTTVLDVKVIWPLTQTGNYLVVLKNAGGNPKRSREIIFKVVNPK
jgi:hypothetical protein